MIEYEIYRQRNAELNRTAAQQRLATEAIRIRREARAQGRPSALGRLAAALRPAPHTDRARVALGEC